MEYKKPEIIILDTSEIENIKAMANSGHCATNTWGCNCGGACHGENLG